MNKYFKSQAFIFWGLLLFPMIPYASFIESTMGAAVVNDATAAFFNPAALTVLKNPQAIALGSMANFRTHFNGQSTQTATGFTQSGSATTQTHYFLPALYLGSPITKKIAVGLAVVINSFNRDSEDNSILRYDQSNSSTDSIDFVPAIGVKFNEFLALGAAANLTHAHFLMRPITGFPSLNIPDSQSRNECSADSYGGDAGILLKPNKTTTIGFNYRSAITYRLHGKSVFDGPFKVVSDHYGYTFWTPARSVISVNQFVTPTLGFIATVQRIQWSILKNINIHDIATILGIIDASVPHRLRDTWLVTLGTHYRVTPKCIIRVAGTYNQAPGNKNYQITTGDSVVIGGSMGYDVNKYITIDGAYAHAIIQKANIHIAGGRNSVQGENKAYRKSVSLKLTINV